MDEQRGFDIVLTTPDTICAQIRAYKKALAAISEGASAQIPENDFDPVGVAPPKSLNRADYIKELRPVISWQMVVSDKLYLTRLKTGRIVKNLIVLKADRKLA